MGLRNGTSRGGTSGGESLGEADLSENTRAALPALREYFEEAADLARRNQFGLLELLALGELQRFVNVPQGKEKEGLRRLEEAASRMGGKPLSAFESVKNW